MSTTKLEIKSFLGKLLFTHETEDNTIKKTVEAAVKSGADLRSADLRYADLRYADLRYADLRYADLQSANLRSADLRYADLRSADLRYADLQSANLQSANLQSADLRYADLRSADLRSANLQSIKNDFWDVLLRAQNEIPGLKTALLEGRVNGSTYSGECACLVGTIANIRHCNYEELGTIQPDSNRPIERFFLGINKNDTSETNQLSKLALEWIEEFQSFLPAPKVEA